MFNQQLPGLLRKSLGPIVCAAGTLLAAHIATAQSLGNVFVIDMENHNLTQPAGQASPGALFGNAAAPYMNSLMTAGNPNAAQTSWASNYGNAAPGNHPSEPNYLWQEAGSNLGVTNDNDPYKTNGSGGSNGTGGTAQNATNLSSLLQAKGVSWKSYAEDTQLDSSGTVLAKSQYTVPLTSSSGVYGGGYANAYNGSSQYNYAVKHVGQVFFTGTNGGTLTTPDMTTSNPEAKFYAPLQQLASDLTANTTASYNVITPNQFNDAHTALTGGFTYNGTAYTGDQANIAQGDNFLSKIIPQIQASQAYKNNGMIDIWWDETEGGDTSAYTLENIIISPLAKGNAYQSTVSFTHSSDLKSYQELFGVRAAGGGFLGDSNTSGINDFSDMLKAGALGTAPVPEASTTVSFGVLFMLGLGALAFKARSGRKAA